MDKLFVSSYAANMRRKLISWVRKIVPHKRGAGQFVDRPTGTVLVSRGFETAGSAPELL